MTTRDRKILLVLAGLAVLAGFWFLVLRPKRTEAAELTTQIAAQQQRLQTARQTVAQGLHAKAGHAGDTATVAQLGAAVPADDDLPSLLYQLDAASRNAHVTFDSLVRAGANGNSSSSPSASGSSGSSGSTGSTGSASASLPPGATVGTAGLATLPFTFSFTGSYFDLQRFVGDLQGFVRADGGKVSVRGRLLTLDGIALVPAAKDLSKIEAKLVATAYLSPDAGKVGAATGAAAGATGTTPAPGASSPPAAAPSSSAITGGTN